MRLGADDLSPVSATPARGRTLEANIPPIAATFFRESRLIGAGLRKIPSEEVSDLRFSYVLILIVVLK